MDDKEKRFNAMIEAWNADPVIGPMLRKPHPALQRKGLRDYMTPQQIKCVEDFDGPVVAGK